MHRFISLILLAAFLTHAIFGCCWAHSDCQQQACECTHRDSIAEHGHSHQNEPAGHQHSPADHESEHPCECSISCVYVATPKAEASSSTDCAVFALTVLPDPMRFPDVEFGSIVWEADTPPPPVPLHLLYQLLLI